MTVETIVVTKNASARKDFLGRMPSEADYDRVISGDVDVVDQDGAPLVVLRRAPPQSCAFLLDACRRVKFSTLQRLGADHMASRSIVFGFSPRVPLRRNFCTSCTLSRDNPDANERLSRWANVADDWLRDHAPWKHAWFKEYSAQIRPEWRINDTLFTSGYVNDSCSLRYHVDKSEIDEAWNIVTVLKKSIAGGVTVLPEYRVAIDAVGPTMFGFSAPSVVHGVTPMRRTSPDGYRYSIVFYTMKEMLKCGSLEEELARVQEWSTGKEKQYRRKGVGE